MPIKTTKTITKSESSNNTSTKNKEKKESAKKVVVKRRKVDLVPTRASAVAIASQANRAKKQALIEKVASSKTLPIKKAESSSDTKIPVWVWTFFGCSLLLFCIAFYQVIIRPQLEGENVNNLENIEWVDEGSNAKNIEITNNPSVIVSNENETNQNISTDSLGIKTPTNGTEIIEELFNRLSNRNFDGAFELMTQGLGNSSEMREHFTAFRMNPFLDGVQGGRLIPTNIKYITSPSYGRDQYNFDLIYSLAQNQSVYEESREVIVNTQGDEPKIASIRCTTSKCSYHPIFWPENFGLLR